MIKRPPLMLAGSLAIMTVALLANGLGATASTRVTASAGSQVRIGLVLPLLSNPTISAVRDGVIAEAKAKNAQVLVTGTNDPAAQAAALQTYINLKVNALIFDPIDSAAVAPAVVNANKAGIPVVAVIGGSTKGRLSTLVSPSWYSLGKTIGTNIANSWCKGKTPCQVAIIGGTNVPGPGLNSGIGLVAGLKTSPNVKIVQTVYTDYSGPQALSAAQAILAAHPNVNFIATWWSEGALSSEAAARAAGKLGVIGTDGMGGACPVLKDILAGNVYADATVLPPYLGKVALDSAIAAIGGQHLPQHTVTPYFFITKPIGDGVLAGTLHPPAAIAPQVIAGLKQAKTGC